MAGVRIRDPFATPIAPKPFSQFGDPASFTAAAGTQANDYDTIMKQYDDLAKSFSTNPLTSSSIAPQTSRYSESPNVASSISNLSNLSTTGGYSAGDIANIRERDISPIRSIYANAQQNVERQKALSGGYSPNFNAVTASMARDEANKIGDVTTAANAGIAQNVASNRIAAAPSYASASASENATRTASDTHNADIVNQINALNESNRLQAEEFNRQGVTGALQGKTSLYGTTPALTNTFGNQVLGAGQLNQNQQGINLQKQRNIFGAAGL